MIVHKPDQRLESIADQYRVTVQQACVARARHAHPEVVVLGVKLVDCIPYQNHLGKTPCHHVSTSISRVVVKADDLESDALSVLVNGLNAVAQQVTGVIAGDDDRQVEHWFNHPLFLSYGKVCGSGSGD